MSETLDRGRAAFTTRSWEQASSSFREADEREPLAGADLELLGVSEFMLGRIDQFFATLERAYARWLSDDDVHRAARCAFYIGIHLATGGEVGRAGGWLGRAQRLV